jgi:hypothetical protein
LSGNVMRICVLLGSAPAALPATGSLAPKGGNKFLFAALCVPPGALSPRRLKRQEVLRVVDDWIADTRNPANHTSSLQSLRASLKTCLDAL